MVSDLVEIPARPVDTKDAANDRLLAACEIVFSTWGLPVLDAALLDRMPNLKAIFYAAGSVRAAVTPDFWERDIRITSAFMANAQPVAEFTLAQIILALKQTWQQAMFIRTNLKFERSPRIAGAYYGSTVGIISLGAIGRLVCKLLKHLEVDVLAYDPYVDDKVFAEMGVQKAGLMQIFEQCDVVSLHTPWLPSTEGMIQEKHFRAMKEGASFINTSRGAVVDEPAMIRVLQERPDIFAMLDVTHPEPPKDDSPLFTLQNVMLTPHIAGSMGRECHRMARLAIEECKRYLNGEPALYPVTAENIKRMA